jgi:predicted DCC family thiol-disulfide oxidoreductase YuxK
MTMRPQPREGWVLYDGDCGICSRWVPSWSPTLQRLGLAVAPLQSPWVQKRTGIPVETLLTDIRLLRPDGRLISGADVYRFVMRRLWWTYPLYLLSSVPGFRVLFDQGYRALARHRRQISASCGLPPNHPPPSWSERE